MQYEYRLLESMIQILEKKHNIYVSETVASLNIHFSCIHFHAKCIISFFFVVEQNSIFP